MRIQTFLQNRNSSFRRSQSMRFESKNNAVKSNSQPHQYTGVASADLAYASMFDNEIARDLKLMGLI